MYFNKVRLAVNKAGGVTKVSNLCGVANNTVHTWVKQGRVSRIDMARQLAKLAGMQVEELRPV